MPVYLAPVIGTGTERDPIRAPYLGDDPRIGWMHLGPAGTNLGSALLYLPAAVADVGFDKVSDDDPREAMPTLTRSRASTRLGVVTSKTPFREWTAELLMDLGNRTVRWGGIVGHPSKARGQYEIWLGGLGRIWSQAVAPTPSTQSFSETWPGADGSITSTRDQLWTNIVGDLQVVGNVCRAGVVNTQEASRCDSALDTSAQRHLATYHLANNAGGENALSVKVRYSAQANQYFFRLTRENGRFQRLTRQPVAGADTTFGNDATDPGGDSTLEMIADGASITSKVGGSTVHAATDATPQLLTNLNGGIQIFAQATLADATLDTHTIADVVAAAGGAPLALFHRYYAGMRA